MTTDTRQLSAADLYHPVTGLTGRLVRHRWAGGDHPPRYWPDDDRTACGRCVTDVAHGLSNVLVRAADCSTCYPPVAARP